MRAMILLIDNYDSFTYNLVQYLGDLDIQTHVMRNDAITIEEAVQKKPKGILISPGPSTPDQAGICLDLVQTAYDQDIPLLGVCLGHQCIGQVFGATVVQGAPIHGKISAITHQDKGVFAGLPSPMEVTRYHSLIVENMPEILEVTAESEDGIVMGLQHKEKPIHGVQFHPESIATHHGHDILKNFINIL